MKILIVLLALVGCAKDPISTSNTDNSNFQVELLFTHEGCRVYRFIDSDRRYFTNCTSTEYSTSYSCGKNQRCAKPESIPNTRN